MLTQKEDATMTTTTTTAAAGNVWTLDVNHTVVEFAVKHMMIATVKGRFADVAGTVTLDERDPTRSTVRVDIEAASIDTHVEQRDQHLRSAEFFDVERWPSISFLSRRVERHDGGYRLIGDLTIRDITRQVVLEVTDEGRGRNPYGQTIAAFTARTTIDRRDFGLTWNQALESGGILVGNDVKISIEAELIQD